MAGEVEVRGFALMLAARVFYAMYLGWLIIPERHLHSIGITYYPSKYWALAGPAWLTLAVVWGLWLYEGLNMATIPHLSDRRQLEDEKCKSPESVGLRGFNHPTAKSVPPLCHIPASHVTQTLFGCHRCGDDDGDG
ncbi:hypothetical protein Vretifemale_19649 [Volvox reticuliferus]|uniref:PIG-P domain-containing protein n=1 Tax=Volvox reticuliferus TaxID=1737510 RepID=A0A8J4CZ36_9CHLO|nr:hypothetical protein Vretifemale_19649 [Volvox reticuliferus]